MRQDGTAGIRLWEDLLDDSSPGSEGHKGGVPGEVLRNKGMANLTEGVREACLPVRFSTVSATEQACWSASHSGRGLQKVEGALGEARGSQCPPQDEAPQSPVWLQGRIGGSCLPPRDSTEEGQEGPGQSLPQTRPAWRLSPPARTLGLPSHRAHLEEAPEVGYE